MGKIKIAIAGVGNCASSLVQGLSYYKGVKATDELIPGLMHNSIGGYLLSDIKVVAAFDIDKRKVGTDVSEAIFSPPNCTIKFSGVQKLGVEVKKGPVLDGVAETTKDMFLVDPAQKPCDVKKELEYAGAEVLVNYMPVGSEQAARFYARAALDAGCGLVNCMPAFIASEKEWSSKFEERKLPVAGDDIKSQVGATILHRVLARLFLERGVKVERTYQLNVGGNSVTGDQRVLLLVDGRVVYTPIGEFVDELMHQHKIVRADGKEIIIGNDLPQTIECLTIDADYRAKIAHVDAFIRHKLSEPLFEIETEEGRRVKITGDHNVFVMSEDGELLPTPVKDLQENESYIAVPASLPLSQREKTSVDISKHCEGLHAEGIENGFFKIHGHPDIKMPVKFPLTNEFLQIVGLWLADGSFDREKNGNIELACGDDSDCVGVVEKFCNSLNINYHVRQRDGIAVRLMSKTLGNIVRSCFSLAGNAYNKRVPSWVFDLSDRQISLVLKGYVSGDGGTIGHQVRWSSVSEELIEDVRTLFLRIGINSTVFKEHRNPLRNKDAYASAVGYCWHGIITSREDIELFIEKVGFMQDYKNGRVLGIASCKKSRELNRRIPHAPALRKKWHVKSTTWYWPPTVNASIVLKHLGNITDPAISKRMRDLCEGDVKFLKIRRITKIPSTEPSFVYDISTKPHERFICSNILVHNTDFKNMLERSRLISKKISKTEAVQSQFPVRLSDDDITIGPSDYVPWLKDKKIAFVRVEGRKFGDVPIVLDCRLDVEDSPNSAGIVVDAVRCCKLALDRKIGGALTSASSYLFKHPPIQFTDVEARRQLEEFISGTRER